MNVDSSVELFVVVDVICCNEYADQLEVVATHSEFPEWVFGARNCIEGARFGIFALVDNSLNRVTRLKHLSETRSEDT